MRSTILQVRRYGVSFVLILVLIAIGGACAIDILGHERVTNPFATSYSVNAAFTSAAGVVPGLGEPVDVAGVHVGEITGVSLDAGQAVIHMSIDPRQLPYMFKDAHAELMPETPLDNMEVDIDPGSRTAGRLPAGGTIPIGDTITPTESDDVLASLDTDSRTWLASLISQVDGASAGRAGDLRALLATLAPTAAETQRVTDLLASRRTQLARIVHNLGLLTQAASTKDSQIQTVVSDGDRTLAALSNQDRALGQSLSLLPGVLSRTHTALGSLRAFSRVLAPSAEALLPPARRLSATLNDANTLLSGPTLLALKRLPPFVSAVLPLTRQLPALTRGLQAETPQLSSAFKVTQYVVNEGAYSTSTNPGFLFWLAWAAHDINSVFSVHDAHGALIRSTVIVSCNGLTSPIVGNLLKTVLGSARC